MPPNPKLDLSGLDELQAEKPKPAAPIIKGELDLTGLEELGLEEPIDLNRPRLKNKDGSFSTEETITIDQDGKFYNIPTIVNGQRISEDEAVRLFQAGINKAVGEFPTLEEAKRRAAARS